MNTPAANTGGVGEGDYIEIANLQPSIGTAGTLNTNGIAAAVATAAGGDEDFDADHNAAADTAAGVAAAAVIYIMVECMSVCYVFAQTALALTATHLLATWQRHQLKAYCNYNECQLS